VHLGVARDNRLGGAARYRRWVKGCRPSRCAPHRTHLLGRELALASDDCGQSPCMCRIKSRWSHFDTRRGRVELMISSKSRQRTTFSVDANGSGPPMSPSTLPFAACRISRSAVSSVQSPALRSATSGMRSAKLATTVLGTTRDLVQQMRRGRRPVGHDKDAGASRGLHRTLPSAIAWLHIDALTRGRATQAGEANAPGRPPTQRARARYESAASPRSRASRKSSVIRPEGTTTRSAGRDCCSSTKPAVCGGRLDPPLTAPLDDQRRRAEQLDQR